MRELPRHILETRLVGVGWGFSERRDTHLRFRSGAGRSLDMKNPMILLVVLVCALGFLSLYPAVFSFMIFDAPDSTRSLTALILFGSIFSFPFVCFGAAIGSLILLWRGKSLAAKYILLAPAINLVACVATFLFLA